MSDGPSETQTSSWRDDPRWPDVDVVMPIRNEADHLESAIGSIRSQGYPGNVRIFLGVAPSDDDTEALAERLAGSENNVVAIANKDETTPAGLNRAIDAGSAPVVVRVDGHSVLSPGYIRTAVDTLRRTGAGNVGGRQVPQPETPFEEAVAAATTSWLGTGGASYRVGARPGPTDTVYLGVFDRAAIEAIGLFDERLIRNQDYELNIRLRSAGQVVWFEPELWVGYRPRGSWTTLARQYYEYGRWKTIVIRMHPTSARLRQIAPTVFVLVMAASLVAASRRPAVAFLPLAYVTAAITAAGGRSWTSPLRQVRVAAVLSTLHVSWGIGSLVGAFRLLGRQAK